MSLQSRTDSLETKRPRQKAAHLQNALPPSSALVANHHAADTKNATSEAPRPAFGQCPKAGEANIDASPVLSSRLIWSPILSLKEIGRVEAIQRRADHRLAHHF
jgi:hypothetical protein